MQSILKIKRIKISKIKKFRQVCFRGRGSIFLNYKKFIVRKSVLCSHPKSRVINMLPTNLKIAPRSPYFLCCAVLCCVVTLDNASHIARTAENKPNKFYVGMAQNSLATQFITKHKYCEQYSQTHLEVKGQDSQVLHQTVQY